MIPERPDSREASDAGRRPQEPAVRSERERAEPPAPEAQPQGLRARITLGVVRVIALIGVVALAVIASAILVGQDVDGWIVGLVIALGVQALTMFILFSRRFAPHD